MASPTDDDLTIDITDRKDPKEVLYDVMNFHRTKGVVIAKKIVDLIKKQDGDIALMTSLYKSMVDANKMVVDAASKLAPFIHPRLSSVDVKSEAKHVYVIEAPQAYSDPTSWLSLAKQQKEALDLAKHQVSEGKLMIEHQP
jgi:hypothetical protein